MKNHHSICAAATLLIAFFCSSAIVTGAEQSEVRKEGITFMERMPEEVIVPFVTLRNRTGKMEPSDYYGGSRGSLETGFCTVNFYPIWGLEDIAESVPFYVPDERIELSGIKESSLTELEREIRSLADKDNGNLVLYIHGYNIDFEKSCRRGALLQRALGLKERLLLFSWPADGSMLKYTWDEADLSWSVPHLASFLEQVFSTAGPGRVDVVAHSLGARGIVQALIRLSYRYTDKLILNELVLIAPDIDTNIFRQELEQLENVVRRITVYVSENDKALKLSQEVHGYPRLGQAGEELTIFEQVETIDISGISLRRFSGHIYHLFNPEVINDLTELLTTGKSAAHRSRLKATQKGGLDYWLLEPRDE
ncbi:MAG: alpha/beta fold hydrolase [Desulfofustis sp.]|nr:alpha/beta fold hydrolase [Desulfofustis sp.]